MTCGMLCVMRRETRGALHLDKYFHIKQIWGGGKGIEKEKKKNKRKNKDNKKEREAAVL